MSLLANVGSSSRFSSDRSGVLVGRRLGLIHGVQRRLPVAKEGKVARYRYSLSVGSVVTRSKHVPVGTNYFFKDLSKKAKANCIDVFGFIPKLNDNVIRSLEAAARVVVFHTKRMVTKVANRYQVKKLLEKGVSSGFDSGIKVALSHGALSGDSLLSSSSWRYDKRAIRLAIKKRLPGAAFYAGFEAGFRKGLIEGSHARKRKAMYVLALG